MSVTHVAIGTTMKAGTVEFNGQKVCQITFDAPFNEHPSITLTLEDSGVVQNPVKTKVKKTDFRILFKNAYTGLVAWGAIGK